MTDLDLLHFEQLKLEVQAEYLKNHHPSSDEISKWKGIDIIYFQEDLRRKAKGNISEKSFYTYFKNSNTSKLPRIDMLNLLAIYADYQSWYDFKKNHLFANEFISEAEKPTEISIANEDSTAIEDSLEEFEEEKTEEIIPENSNLQNNTPENQINNNTEELPNKKKNNTVFDYYFRFQEYIWLGISVVLLAMVLVLIFWQRIFATEYTFTFIDADRNTKILDNIEIKILKENETPIQYNLEDGKDFVYPTQSKSLKMVVNSPFYKKDTIRRTLDPARTKEVIELEPDVYSQTLFYYSTNDINKKREELDKIISNNALIYQVYDNYGVETLNKQTYIGLVTTPTTSLKNFKMIETKVSPETRKIVLIKFKIQQDENK
ncbi:hypothetical protein GCM10010992_09660 [Cloacibacterium rupense]|uniref:Uncharacterized protein n=1 Tax=Cloacibacterium rupense TaxID=517423 RepID=A0ABQ2NHJ0_9FLAO|nr:hypothetical protein [Cloacibacterium rupense]GGP03002.1 hypothetical protein GCM10010992_09660 [Cloacibacterium rupense]